MYISRSGIHKLNLVTLKENLVVDTIPPVPDFAINVENDTIHLVHAGTDFLKYGLWYVNVAIGETYKIPNSLQMLRDQVFDGVVHGPLFQRFASQPVLLKQWRDLRLFLLIGWTIIEVGRRTRLVNHPVAIYLDEVHLARDDRLLASAAGHGILDAPSR